MALALAVIVAAFLLFSPAAVLHRRPRVPATFALHYPLLVVHVMFGSVAMVRPSLRSGRGCAPSPGAAPPDGARLRGGRDPCCGIRDGHRRGHTVRAVARGQQCRPGALWLWFTINGFMAARQRRFVDHRRHMLRSATLALSTISNRIWTPILFITLHRCRTPSLAATRSTSSGSSAGLGAWLGWTIRWPPCSGG